MCNVVEELGMKMDEHINYIVSGIERSGTSMLMQALHNGGAPVAFDDKRQPDDHNPKGYFELEGGKIINKLMEGTFPMEKYRGTFIKITAFGLQYIPPGNYKIIYSERDLDEILDSMEKMAQIKDENRQETKESFLKLNEMIKQKMQRRDDVDLLLVNYNKTLENPSEQFQHIYQFLQIPDIHVPNMVKTVDEKLYRQRRS